MHLKLSQVPTCIQLNFQHATGIKTFSAQLLRIPEDVILKPNRDSIPHDPITIEKRPNLLLLGVAQHHIQRAPVILQVLNLPGARDREDILALLQQPRERQLRQAAALPLGEGAEARHDGGVAVAVRALELRQHARPDVRVFEGRRRALAAEVRGQEAAAQGRGHDDGDAEFAARGEEVRAVGAFDAPVEDGVFGLDGGDGGDFDGAAECR